jgi:hypothetical protein
VAMTSHLHLRFTIYDLRFHAQKQFFATK